MKNPVQRVMVVDDDEINNFLCRKVIGIYNANTEVNTFIEAKTALEYLKEKRSTPHALPDLIMLDINMPIVSGWEFLEAYQALTSSIEKDIYIAILSSSVYQKDREKASAHSSIRSYVSKPLTLESYKQLMDNLTTTISPS